MRNQSLFLQAYEEFADPIFRYCFVRVQQRELARDLTQEAFVKTWEYLADGKVIKNIRAFLYKVANNLIIDHSRRKQASSLDAMMGSGFDVATQADEQLQAAIDVQYVLKLLQQLDEKYRHVITLRYIDDLPIGEIAEIVGENENVVSVRIHRAVQQLKKILAAQ